MGMHSRALSRRSYWLGARQYASEQFLTYYVTHYELFHGMWDKVLQNFLPDSD
jgi:hypothetical protein